MAEGLKLPIMRSCLDTARDLVGDDHPFSTRRFKTDGERIYLETLDRIVQQDRQLEAGASLATKIIREAVPEGQMLICAAASTCSRS